MRPSYKTAVTIVYVMGVFIQILDATVVNVALPTLGKEFDVPANEIEWVLLGYLLSFIIGIPAAAWLADRFGSKRAFMLALGGFVVASALCGAALSLNQLIAARILQGLPAGLITPIGATILYRAYPQEERAKAAAAIVGVAVIAPSIGPVLGGIIVDNFSWRWIFYVNVPMGVAALVLAGLWLEEHKEEGTGSLDIVGFGLAGVGLAGVLYATTIGPREGWLGWQTLTSAVVGVACLVALVVFELRQEKPMVDFRLLSNPHFRNVNLASIFVYAGFIGLIYLIPQYIQEFRGLSATQAGTTQAPQALGVFVVSNLVARRLYGRFGPRLNMLGGITAALVISGLFAFVGDDTNLWLLRGAIFARGAAMGVLFVTIQTIAYSTMSIANTGKAVSIFSTQRQVANAIGTAVVATTLSMYLDVEMSLNAYRISMAVAALLFAPALWFAWHIDDNDAAASLAHERAGRAARAR